MADADADADADRSAGAGTKFSVNFLAPRGEWIQGHAQRAGNVAGNALHQGRGLRGATGARPYRRRHFLFSVFTEMGRIWQASCTVVIMPEATRATG